MNHKDDEESPLIDFIVESSTQRNPYPLLRPEIPPWMIIVGILLVIGAVALGWMCGK